MKYKWLNKFDNNDLIIFFNGWGMDESIVANLNFSNYDVLMFYDYNSLDTDFDYDILSRYSTKNLIAWSMGVMVATIINIKYDYKVAVNGTLKPVDDKFGIPERIYDYTIKNFSNKSRDIFIKNMFNGNFIKFEISRDVEEQKNELVALREYKANYDFKYDKILISESDNIIPTRNQVLFWGVAPNLKGGHAPFLNFESWEELL